MTVAQIDAVIDVLPIPVLIVGSDDRVLMANAPLVDIFGPELIGKHYITVMRQPAIIDAVGKVRGSANPAMARFVSRDGDKDVTYRVSLAKAGEDIVLTFEDQTAAEDAGKMRREFVANVSHELRTPLTALLGFIETLSGAARDDPDARDRFLAIMAHEANRMTRLVDDLLSLSRVEEDERVRPREHVDLAVLLSSVIKGLEPQAKTAGVVVKLDIQGGNEMVPGDPGQLVQVITNLVENGIKYGAAG